MPAVVVTAAEVLTGLGAGLAATWAALAEGRVAVAPETDPASVALGASASARAVAPPPAPAPDGPTRVLTPHGERLDRVARAAHAAAGLDGVPREAVALHVALGVVDSPADELAPALAASRDDDGAFRLARFFGGGFRGIHPHWPLRMLNNVVVGQLAADLDVRGDNMVLSAEADAGARGFVEARAALLEGAALAALVAASSETVGPAAFLRARARGAPGLVVGEGAGAVVLETEASAAARGRVVVGRLVGAATTFGPSDVGPGPSAETTARAVRAALSEAGRGPQDVALLVVEGERVDEAEARRVVFGRRPDLPVLAPAVALGHLGPAAPAVVSALALAALRARAVPSSARGTPRPVGPGLAVVLASGSGGGAGALVWEGAR